MCIFSHSELTWPSVLTISHKTVDMTSTLSLLFTDTYLCPSLQLLFSVYAFLHVSVNIVPVTGFVCYRLT